MLTSRRRTASGRLGAVGVALLPFMAIGCGASADADERQPGASGRSGVGGAANPALQAPEPDGESSVEGLGGSGALQPGSAGAGAGSTATPSGDDVVGDAFVGDVQVTVHPRVNTILVVNWAQRVEADSVLIEFTFEDGVLMRSRPRVGAVGAQRDVVLGVPGNTDVTVRIVSRRAGIDIASSDHRGRTGAVPSGPNGMPPATILAYDPSIASAERWLLGSVENSEGGCGPECYNRWTYWTYIMDRKGRIVWYYADPASNATSSFQRRARVTASISGLKSGPTGAQGRARCSRLPSTRVLGGGPGRQPG